MTLPDWHPNENINNDGAVEKKHIFILYSVTSLNRIHAIEFIAMYRILKAFSQSLLYINLYIEGFDLVHFPNVI